MYEEVDVKVTRYVSEFDDIRCFLGAGFAAKLSVSAASGIKTPVLSFGTLIQRMKLLVLASLVEEAS